MSVKLSDQAYKLRLPRAQKAVLVAMCSHANDDGGGCYPGLDTLAAKTAYDRRHVQRQQAMLEALGLIVRVGNTYGGRGKTVEYQIRLSATLPEDMAATKPATRAAPKRAARATDSDSDDLGVSKGDSVGAHERKGDISAEKGGVLSGESMTPAAPKGDIRGVAHESDGRGIVRDSSQRTVPEKEPSPRSGAASHAETACVFSTENGAGAEEDRSHPGGGARPTLAQVAAYFELLGMMEDAAEQYFDYYTSNGWKVGGRGEMRDWRAAARNWKRNAAAFAAGPGPGTGSFPEGGTRSGAAVGSRADAPFVSAEDAARRERERLAGTNAARRFEADKAALARLDAQIDALPPTRRRAIQDKASAMYAARWPGMDPAKASASAGIRAIMRTIYQEQSR